MSHILVQTYRKKPVLLVMTESWSHRYPLTPTDCRQAGADLFLSGVEEWGYSSSVDFPREVKPGFRGDVRILVAEGWQAAFDVADAPRKSLVAKMFAWCDRAEFRATLTPEEKAEYKKIKKANR